jgi:hypothetical protein
MAMPVVPLDRLVAVVAVAVARPVVPTATVPLLDTITAQAQDPSLAHIPPTASQVRASLGH